MTERYGVIIEEYCKRHYIKSFLKKYKKKRWDLTEDAIISIAANPLEASEGTSSLELISDHGDVRVYKGFFKVFGTNVSAKSSGNRFILLVNTNTKLSRVLLIYGKDHVTSSGETRWWKTKILNNFKGYKEYIR
ncbi:MAG: hypothetical protein WD579_02480 [Candidatus Paceibacterota bacterium]